MNNAGWKGSLARNPQLQNKTVFFAYYTHDVIEKSFLKLIHFNLKREINSCRCSKLSRMRRLLFIKIIPQLHSGNFEPTLWCQSHGAFTLPDTNSDSDSKANGYIVICRTFHIAQTRIPTPYFCIGQESKSESVPESISGNVNEPSESQ